MEWGMKLGRKRQPTDELTEEQPLAKRLSKLHLTNGKTYLLSACHYTSTQYNQSLPVVPQPPQEERMDVDNVVYIDSLDSDSDTDDLDSKVMLIRDIDHQLTKMPYNLCSDASKNALSTSTELVLYSIPTSLTVPEQKDNVRRAILEARARLREKQVHEAEVEAQATAAAAAETPVQLFGNPIVMDQVELEGGEDPMDIEEPIF